MYAMWIRKFLTFIDGEKINIENVMRFREWMREKEYSPKSVQYALTIVRDYVSYQMTVHDLKFPLKLLKIPQERSNSHHAITQDEYEKMLSVLPQNHPITLQYRLIVSLLWDTGMRGGELVRLRMSDIKGTSAIINTEKNHRKRLVAWSRETDRLLKLYLPLRKELQAKDDSLLVSLKKPPRKQITTRQLERIFKEVSKKAGLGLEIRPHGMRHAFTHQQLRKRQPITIIAQMLGHSTVYNVLTYSQLASKEIEEAWGI